MTLPPFTFKKRFSFVVTMLFLLIATPVMFFFVATQGHPDTSVALADDTCQYFSETNHKVCGKFLIYWQSHGGLAQQGYPVSDVFAEKNAAPPAGDGKVHNVQYFQRARFEEHLENQPPYDVLLGLLGSEQFGAKYPGGNTNATPTPVPSPPSQVPSSHILRLNSQAKYPTLNGNSPKSGFVFLVVDITITNNTTSKISTNPNYFSVATDKGYSYDYDDNTFQLPKELVLKDLQPGQSLSGQLAFQVPTDETPKLLEYQLFDITDSINL